MKHSRPGISDEGTPIDILVFHSTRSPRQDVVVSLHMVNVGHMAMHQSHSGCNRGGNGNIVIATCNVIETPDTKSIMESPGARVHALIASIDALVFHSVNISRCFHGGHRGTGIYRRCFMTTRTGHCENRVLF